MYDIIVQSTVSSRMMPKKVLLKNWATAVLKTKINAAELTIRVVDPTEMTELNTQYRHKQGTTNVLSFPFDMPDELADETPILGDIIICADVVNREAEEQHKTREAHWAHMVIHGTLHLLGYDHETENDANIMEPEEINILATLGFNNPYQQGEKS